MFSDLTWAVGDLVMLPDVGRLLATSGYSVDVCEHHVTAEIPAYFERVGYNFRLVKQIGVWDTGTYKVRPKFYCTRLMCNQLKL